MPLTPIQGAYIRIWDIESKKELSRSEEYPGKSFFDEFPMPRKRAQWVGDGTVQILDVESGNVLRKIVGDIGRAYSILSPDEKMIVTAEREPYTTVRVWDVESGRELRILGKRERPAMFAIFSPDNKKIVTAEQDRTVRIWDAESGKELKKLEISSGGDPIVYSPDGKKIAAARGGGSIQILDTELGKVQELRMPDTRSFYPSPRPPDVLYPEQLPLEFGNIYSVAWSPDGKKVAATADYGFAGIFVLE